MSTTPISPLRRRRIEEMTVRGIGEKTQNDYIRRAVPRDVLSPLDQLTPFTRKKGAAA